MTTDTRPDIPLGCTRDDHGNVLAYKDSKGHWREYTRDIHGRVLTYKNSKGYWRECTRDEQGRELTRKNSTGYWHEYTRDDHGGVLTYKNSTGLWITLAIDPGYTLRHNAVTGIYWAGCREFTAEQALDHWSVRDDPRAMQFTAAIINHLGAPT